MASAPAAFKEAPVTFQGPEGFPLSGILCEPTADPEASWPFRPQQCAILCHGFASHKNGFHFPAIAHHLAQQLGLSSLRFDYTGNMDSPGPFRFASFVEEVGQMAAAKRFLEETHSKQVILLLGHSRGAINATLYSGQPATNQPPQHHQQQQQQQPQCQQAARSQPQPQAHQAAQQHPQQPDAPGGQPLSTAATDGSIGSSTSTASWGHVIPLVVLVAGRYDLTLNMHQRYGRDVLQQLQQSGPVKQRVRRDGDGHEIHWELDAQDMAQRFALDVAGACDTISSLPESLRPTVLVLHGACDPICEASDAANLARHITGSHLQEVEGADHWFKGCEQQLLDAVEGFALAAGLEKGLVGC